MTTTSIRVALYARYSTDKQKETSIDDQLRAAKARALAQGWHVTAIHQDEGISGSTPLMLRAGGKALMADVLAQRVDVIILEGLDRLGREVGESETIVKRIEHRGIRIIGTADGYDSEARGRKVMRIARGLVNEMYLDDLREKTHRGLAGQFDRGMSAGGRCYGYRSKPAPDERGHHMVIDEDEAAIVRWVFEGYAAGNSARELVARLNAQGTPSARGGTWAVSAVFGSAAKGLGLLNNELYLGRVTWNKRQWLKDPDTGKRRYVTRPQHEWQTRAAPELQIVSDELWQRVQARKTAGAGRGSRTGKGSIPKTLLGGLLRCACCGGSVIAVNATRYGCGVRKDRGASVCSAKYTVHRDLLDKRLISELRDELVSPAALADLQKEVSLLLAHVQKESFETVGPARQKAKNLRQEVDRLVDAITSIGISPALQERLKQAEAALAVVDQQLQASAKIPAAPTVSDVMGRYKRLVLNLQTVLEEDKDRDRTRQMLADMLGTVVVGRDKAGKAFADLDEPAERLLLKAVGESLKVVAGAGFEPTTFGL